MRLALAQINPIVGDLDGNALKILNYMQLAAEQQADLVIFSELVLTGYPPEDLLLKPSFVRDAEDSFEAICRTAPPILGCLGLPRATRAGIHNAAALFRGLDFIDYYDKGTLPNYSVFDEKRYFTPSVRCPVYQWGAWPLGINICEDIWVSGGVPRVQARAGARLLINISASPYHKGKSELREQLYRHRAAQYSVYLVCVNQVGGQDELVFDGASLVLAPDGSLLARAHLFQEDLLFVDLPHKPPAAAPAGRTRPLRGAPDKGLEFLEDRLYPDPLRLPENLPEPRPESALDPIQPRIEPIPEITASIYQALLLGLGDYVRKNGFQRVVIGLSGGIDSALTATLAAEALGPAAVTGLAMPSPYSSAESLEDARALCRRLKIGMDILPIDAVFQSYRDLLKTAFEGRQEDVTEENLQARIRGNLLMAYSNKFGSLVLATGNKSEFAVGYCTLYGDMAGGFAVLKDVFKTRVFELSHWRNRQGPGEGPIPRNTLLRPPSAELRENQTDQDTLPPYDKLDAVLQLMVEEDLSPREITARGFEAKMVSRIFKWVDGNEYKRRQAPPGVKLTPRAFGKDRRYPLTNRYRPQSD
jgi:NAD+ synthase (glutamine-hydrolysing)